VEAVASSISSARTGARRIKPAGFLLAVLTLAVLAAGGWGVISSLNTEASPARIGEAVGIPGGLLRVDQVTSEHMASMQNSKFAASGMSMSSMGMDMAPEGQQRFAVDVTLAAERGDLSYSPKDFRLTAAEMKKGATPIRSQLDGGTIPAGGAISGSLVFQVPEEASALMLAFGEGGQKVALDLEPASEGNGHSHGGVQPQGGDEHSDGHHHK
jgi:Domain of unknown function (DUF4352)